MVYTVKVKSNSSNDVNKSLVNLRKGVNGCVS